MKNLLNKIMFLLVVFVLTMSVLNAQNIPCKNNPKYYDNGILRACELSMDYTIEGYTIPANSKIDFTKKGKLFTIKLAKEDKLLNQIFPKGTTIFLNHWIGAFSFWLPKQMIIQGHLLPSNFDGISGCMYTNGKLSAIWLQKDEIIEGIPCSSSNNIFKYGLSVISKGTNRMVFFHENGRLQQAMLSTDLNVQGHEFKKGDLIRFDQSGKIIPIDNPKIFFNNSTHRTL